MIESLPKLNGNYKVDLEGLREELLKKEDFEEDDMFIFMLPAKKQSLNIEIDLLGLHSYNPMFRKFENLYSEDREAAFNILKWTLNDAVEEGFDSFLLGYGTLDTQINFDGFVKGLDKLEDQGASIVNAYFTAKRDDLYYSEPVFDLNMNNILNDLILSQDFKSIVDLTELKAFIEDLKLMVKHNRLHKESPEMITLKVRDLFYNTIHNIKDIEKKQNIDIFLTCADFLNYMGILNIYATTIVDNKIYDYFLENEKIVSMNHEDYSLSLGFHERFIKIFS